MTKIYHVATAAVLLASTASAQDYYFGSTLSVGQVSFEATLFDIGSLYEGDTQSVSLLAGARFPIGGTSGTGMFAGGEIEASFGQGFNVLPVHEVLEDSQTTLQAELHIGYQMDAFAVYGFYGVGNNPMTRSVSSGESNLAVYGVGADVDISNNLALRVELEMSSMSVDACNNYDPVDLSRVSVGCIVKF